MIMIGIIIRVFGISDHTVSELTTDELLVFIATHDPDIEYIKPYYQKNLL